MAAISKSSNGKWRVRISWYDYTGTQTIGTFQFESPGMQKYLRELKPTVFEDLIAMNALYRGPKLRPRGVGDGQRVDIPVPV